MSENAPRRAVVMIAKIEANTRRDLANHLHNLALDLESGEVGETSISGSPSSGHIVHLSEMEGPTRDEYFAQLDGWLTKQKDRAHDQA